MTVTPSTSVPSFDQLARRFGLTRQEMYALALMEALAQQFGHQPRQVAPDAWEIDSRSQPGEKRHVTQVGHRLYCDCPAAVGDAQQHRKPRICTHTAAVHLTLCKQRGLEPPVRPMPPWVMGHDPSPEARAALALIERPRPAKAQPTLPAAQEPALAATAG